MAQNSDLQKETLDYYQSNAEKFFDGVWACSSMLHVPKSNMINVLNKLCTALKHDGILYTSFKYGDDEVFRNGRLFSNYDEESFQAVKVNNG